MGTHTIRQHAWAWYLAGAVFVGQYYVVSGYGAETNDGLGTALSLSAVAAIVIGLALHRPRRWLAPVLVAASICEYLAADAVLAGLEADNVIVPFPSLADWLYLAVYPVLAIAMILVARPGSGRVGLATGAGIGVSAAATAVLWWMYGSDLWSSPFFDETQRRVAVAYPLADAVLLGAGVASLLLARRISISGVLLAAAGAAVVVGNAAYNVAAMGSGHETGGVASVGWIAFTVLMGGAILHPSIGAASQAPADEAEQSSADRAMALVDADQPARELVGV